MWLISFKKNNGKGITPRYLLSSLLLIPSLCIDRLWLNVPVPKVKMQGTVSYLWKRQFSGNGSFIAHLKSCGTGGHHLLNPAQSWSCWESRGPPLQQLTVGMFTFVEIINGGNDPYNGTWYPAVKKDKPAFTIKNLQIILSKHVNSY